MDKYTLEYYFSPRFNEPITDTYHSILIDKLEMKDGFVDRVAEDLINKLAPLLDVLSKIDFVNFNKQAKHAKLVEILENNCPPQYAIMVGNNDIIPANIILFRLAMKSGALAYVLDIDHYIN